MRIPLTTDKRRELLKRELQKHIGQRYYCPALGAKVRVTASSITETAQHAARSIAGTRLALRLPLVIKMAAKTRRGLEPKPGTQTKEFHFLEIITMVAEIKGIGKAKLTVGRKRQIKKNKYIEYCITELRA